MEKEKFDFLKTMAWLENCIEVVRMDVYELLDELPKESDINGAGIQERVENLKYWFEAAIRDYDA